MSEYVFKPISENLKADSIYQLYESALHGVVYNSVADACKDLETVKTKLVNGFCVVLFPGAGAIAFEIKTGVSRGPAAPEVENTVKGPKDAFVETIRIKSNPPSSAHPGYADLWNNGGTQKSHQCGGGLDRGDHESEAG